MDTIAPDKLGNLQTLSTLELDDLLRRQEVMVKNKNFLGRLPDKGAKILAAVERIRTEILSRQDVDQTAELFEKMSMDADTLRQPAPGNQNQHQDEGMDILGVVINRNGEQKVVHDERTLEADRKPGKTSDRSSVWHNDAWEDRFIPNKNLHIKTIRELQPDELESLKNQESTVSKHGVEKSPPQKISSQENMETSNKGTTKLKYKYDESLEADIKHLSHRHEAIKAIPLEEALNLQLQQKKKWEEMRSKQAMERLAQGLHLKIGEFDAEGSRKMEYRVHEDEDSDDEPE